MFPQIIRGIELSCQIDPAKDPTGERSKNLLAERIKNFNQTIEKCKAAIDAGYIANPEFKACQEVISRLVEHSWRSIKDSVRSKWNRDTLPADVFDASWDIEFYGYISRASSTLKKIDKLKIKHEYIDFHKNFMLEVLPLQEMLNTLKPLAVKRVPKAPEDVKAKYLAPRVPGSASAKIFAILTETVDASYNELLTIYENRYLSIVKNHPEVVKNFVPTKINREFSLYAAYVAGGQDDFQSMHLLSKLTENDGKKLLPNAKTLAKEEAKKVADDIRLAFLVKNLKKIESIVVAKGNFKDCTAVEHTVSLAGFRGTFYVSFEDGSSFRFENSVVQSYSKYDKPFLRFPLTFHDGVLLNGERMVGHLSQERMNKVFGGA